MRGYREHKFYCINCGKEGMPLMRQIGHQHESFHRKKLYCPWCKKEVNHVELKTQEDILQFKEDFEKGLYKEEAEESILYSQNTSK